MPDYDFRGLSSRSFEQMIQALAVEVIGPGVVVFGDGPDGGREATFQGKLLKFPSAGNSWDGYTVIQAKFCQRPKGKPNEDASWATQQLRKELNAYVKKGTKRKRPQFYIFVTNVVLSAVANTGGKDALSRLLDEFKEKIDLKDYRVWDYDQICRFLDSDQHVRNAYGAWITAGDVLTKLAAVIDQKTPDFTKVMVNFLQKELLDDHFSKLEQAGHSPENRVALEKVFVDLPAFKEPRSQAPEETDKLSPGFLAEILSIGSTCLRPEETTFQRSRESSVRQTRNELGRFVLVGGPGQGKSTLAQFLCQIQRANLLKPRSGLDPEVKQVVDSITTSCSSQRLILEVARRFPLRLELARLAKALASQAETKVVSVLSYIAYIVKARTNYEVTVEDMRYWLEKYPWLVVLDGLDEVPASSNRDQVLTAVRDFLVDISMCNADVLILATTRPQGYNDDFSPERYQHLWLAPLSIPRAIHYGQTLVEQTYAHNEQRKKEVLARLKKASTNSATARLMESPLQVTIMTQLLAQIAEPPQERYKLFQQYYKVIYRREIERGVEILSQLLRDHEANIDSIHHRMGLLLQMESERTRYTDATISTDEFKGVVTDRLKEEGYSGKELQHLADQIVTCATGRLVFLVPSLSERVGFEIRSLQEFMAAEALMDGPDKLVVERLRAIAPVPFWQNVLLFAAGKCFAERQWLRDSVTQICAQLNDDPDDNLAHLVLAGSRTAVSFLEDGPARRQPAYAQTLARTALSLLGLLPEGIHKQISDVFEANLETVYREELSDRFQGSHAVRALGAWELIIRLSDNKEVPWAQEMAELHWPPNIDAISDILEHCTATDSPWAMGKYDEILFDVPFVNSLTFGAFDAMTQKSCKGKTNITNALGLGFLGSDRGLRISIPQLTGMEFNMTRINDSQRLLHPFSTLESVHEYWEPLKLAARVANHPSAENIAQVLEAFGDSFAFRKKAGLSYASALPWPISACLAAAESKEQIQDLATRLRSGEMGGLDDWKEAEARWQAMGISERDLIHMTDERWPIPRDIGQIGFPFAYLKLGVPFNFRLRAVGRGNVSASKLETFWHSLPGARAKATFAPLVMLRLAYPFIFESPRPSKAPVVDMELISDIVNNLDRGYLPAVFTYIVFFSTRGSAEAPRIWDELGKRISASEFFSHEAKTSELKELLREVAASSVSWLERNQQLEGLANLLVAVAGDK